MAARLLRRVASEGRRALDQVRRAAVLPSCLPRIADAPGKGDAQVTSPGEPTSTKPYLLRAVYEWCVDNGYTPQISVVVDARTRVPMEYARDGEIVINIGPLAANRLKMGNDIIECAARFSGASKELVIPIAAVTAIYARETGHGMSFERERNATEGEAGGGEAALPGPKDPPKPGGKPALRR